MNILLRSFWIHMLIIFAPVTKLRCTSETIIFSLGNCVLCIVLTHTWMAWYLDLDMGQAQHNYYMYWWNHREYTLKLAWLEDTMLPVNVRLSTCFQQLTYYLLCIKQHHWWCQAEEWNLWKLPFLWTVVVVSINSSFFMVLSILD